MGAVRARLLRGLDRRFARLEERMGARVGRVEERLGAIEQSLEQLHRGVEAVSRTVEENTSQASPSHRMLRALTDDDAGSRCRLEAVRADPGSAAAWEEPEPLVSILVCARERAGLLGERALPSLLGQTYERLEIVIVGDDATPAVQAVARGTGDPRVSFVNLTTRVVKPTARERWMTAGTLPRNEGYARARGRWLLDFDDDDALRTGAVEALLAHARGERAEVVYGIVDRIAPDGTTELGGFPPALGQISMAGALVHAGLRFFAREHVASDLGLPGDWYRIERMLKAGVRFAHLREVVLDYYPSSLWDADSDGAQVHK